MRSLLEASGSIFFTLLTSMQSLNLATHIVNAVYIVRTNTIILWFLTIIGLLSSFNSLYPDNPGHPFILSVFILTAIIASPVIYGIYYEVITDTYSSVPAIGKKYILQYVLLLFRMYLPVIFIATLPVLSQPDSVPDGYFQMTIISCSLLFLYVIPTFYVSGRQGGAIFRGVGFLFRNLQASAPLILIALFAEAILLVFELNKQKLLEISTPIFVGLDFFVFMTANILDFVLFVTIVFVLIEQGSKKVDSTPYSED